MLVHLVSGLACYDLASYLTLIAGAVAMVPTTLSGWHEWKTMYKGIQEQAIFNQNMDFVRHDRR
jgi:hypothetical protein